jgi:hypothetical protein
LAGFVAATDPAGWRGPGHVRRHREEERAITSVQQVKNGRWVVIKDGLSY